MKRREFIAALGGAATLSLSASLRLNAQSGRVPRVGVLMGIAADDPEALLRVKAFESTWPDLRWVNGRNIKVDYRWAPGDRNMVRARAAELVADAPDVILAGGTPVLAAVREATRSIPIVFIGISDPEGTGVVSNLARPGGNITRFANFEPRIIGKWLQVLREVAPQVTRVGMLRNADALATFLQMFDTLGPSFGIEPVDLGVRNAAELVRAMGAFAGQPNAGLIVLPDPMLVSQREAIIEFAARDRIPHTRRRAFIAALGGAAAWPVVAGAQSSLVRRVGVLMNGAATGTAQQSYVAAFVRALRQEGWTEGQNVRIDIRWSAGDDTLARTYAAQLIGLMPDVILTSSTTNLTAIQQATSTVPVVFVQVSDPVEQGFVTNVTRPGGNLTGFSMFEFSVGGKWLDLLKEIAPGLSRVGVMFNPDTSPQSKFFMRSIEAAVPSHAVQTMIVPVRTTAEIEPALDGFARASSGGLILPTDTFTNLRDKLIADLAARYRLPAISAYDSFPKDGGLMYYGANINLADQFQQAAGYVDRILKGMKPGDLPVQRADRYSLVINLKTAKALGLTVPQTLLALADGVVE